jgi:aspartyl-tRNA synthetase
MTFQQRTHLAGLLRAEHIGQHVIINGWVAVSRDLGGLLFFDMRDRSGKLQCVIQPSAESMMLYEEAKQLRAEFVVSVEGFVREREKKNPKMPTGDIEVLVTAFTILNQSEVPPFEIKEDVTANEDLRLKYRYLDLRRPNLANNLAIRHRITQSIRKYFDERGFLEIETPILMKATPEGARDFLVPSRLHKGKFYALPQSPQIYKQLFMVAGLDRYFQIAKCFRDEDLRADRQPEFTQLDVEMSFPNEEVVHEIMEGCLRQTWSDLGYTLPPFASLTYKQAMERYGSDKPDLRFGIEITTLTEVVRGKTEFKAFTDALEKKRGVIGAVVAKGAADWSRKQLEQVTDHAKIYGAGGLIWMKVTDAGIDSSAKKFLTDELSRSIVAKCGATSGDLILIVSHSKWDRAYTILGAVRSELAKRLGLVEGKAFEFAPLWVTDMPMFEHNEESGEFVPMHHPFTSPNLEDWARTDDGLEHIRARSYDIVVNGYELGSGSIRIHDRKLQVEVFDMLKISKEAQQHKFGFLLEAFQYGAPPHGGMALGIDRIAMLCCGTDNIRDVIAFPKTASMQSLMDDAPSTVEPYQMRDLHIATTGS